MRRLLLTIPVWFAILTLVFLMRPLVPGDPVEIMIFGLGGLSMPAFWFGLLMIYIFAVRLRWFSVIPDGSLKSLVLPAVTLGLIASSIVARLVRSSMLEVLGQDFIRTARAKGLRER